MAEIRRMRRFHDNKGNEYDELPCGKLRRRLKNGDTSPLPAPQTRKAIEAKKGALTEIDPVVLAKSGSAWRRRCTRCSNSNFHGCTGSTKARSRR